VAPPATRYDSEIDLSDAPELSAEHWKKRIRGHFYRPVKQQITARVDSDALACLKSQGNNNQSRINDILRREMHMVIKAACSGTCDRLCLQPSRSGATIQVPAILSFKVYLCR
jgi:uncharacterized protein (DUF4415 family)